MKSKQAKIIELNPLGTITKVSRTKNGPNLLLSPDLGFNLPDLRPKISNLRDSVSNKVSTIRNKIKALREPVNKLIINKT